MAAKETVTPVVPEEVVATPEVKSAEKMVEIELHARFVTNGEVHGIEPIEDANGDPVSVKVTVPEHIAEDLLRRQKEFDRMERDRFRERKFGRFSTPQN